MKKLLAFLCAFAVCGSVAIAQQAPFPSAVGTLPYLNASGGVVLPASPPMLCSLNVGGSFVGTVSFLKNGSALTVNSFSSAITSTTAPVDTVFVDNAADTINVQMTSYTSGTATWSINCVEATAYNSGQSTGASLTAANNFTNTNTFANIIDNGLSASDTCVASNGSKQLIDGTNCAGLSISDTFTNFINNTYVPSGACQTNAPTAPVCIGSPTSAIAIAIGHATNAWGVGTNDNSGQIQFYYGAGGTEQHCGLWIAYGNGELQETGSRACGFQVNGTLDVNTEPIKGATKIGTAAACSGTTPLTSSASNNIACRITAASSTAVLTFGTAYTAAPVCTANDETTVTSAVKVAVTTTSVTLTPPGASDVLDVICIGNGGL